MAASTTVRIACIDARASTEGAATVSTADVTVGLDGLVQDVKREYLLNNLLYLLFYMIEIFPSSNLPQSSALPHVEQILVKRVQSGIRTQPKIFSG